jgi:transposase, IS5 family
MPVRVGRANGAKSKVRAAVEHVFARQKGPMGLIVRTIGLARATVKSASPTSSTTCGERSG